MHDDAFKNEVDQVVQDIKATGIHNRLVVGEKKPDRRGRWSGTVVRGDSNQIDKS